MRSANAFDVQFFVDNPDRDCYLRPLTDFEASQLDANTEGRIDPASYCTLVGGILGVYIHCQEVLRPNTCELPPPASIENLRLTHEVMLREMKVKGVTPPQWYLDALKCQEQKNVT